MKRIIPFLLIIFVLSVSCTNGPEPSSSEPSSSEHICDWKETARDDSSCVESGSVTYNCTICGKEKTETIKPKGHTLDLSSGINVAPTCTEVGYTKYTCILCGSEVIDATSYISPLGHDLVDDVYDVVNPTCTERGYTRHLCSRCNLPAIDESSYINALGHTLEEGVVSKEPTCEETGIEVFHCSVCDNDVEEELERLPHHWIEDHLLVDYTCSNTGEFLYHCKNCNETKIRITKAAHHWVKNIVSGVYECSICGHEMEVGDIGPAGGLIFYDKGQFIDGWRYIEAAPNDLQIINGIPFADSFADGYVFTVWHRNTTTNVEVFHVEGYVISDEWLYVNGTTKYGSDCTGTAIGTGKQNTYSLYDLVKGTEKSAIQYTIELECNGFTDWFVPSIEELRVMKSNIYDYEPERYEDGRWKKGYGNFMLSDSYGEYLSSSESSTNVYGVMGVRFYDGWEFNSSRGGGLQVVRPCRYL